VAADAAKLARAIGVNNLGPRNTRYPPIADLALVRFVENRSFLAGRVPLGPGSPWSLSSGRHSPDPGAAAGMT
jgi:hypothetical protein